MNTGLQTPRLSLRRSGVADVDVVLRLHQEDVGSEAAAVVEWSLQPHPARPVIDHLTPHRRRIDQRDSTASVLRGSFTVLWPPPSWRGRGGDGLGRVLPPGARKVLPKTEHRIERYANNRIESDHASRVTEHAGLTRHLSSFANISPST